MSGLLWRWWNKLHILDAFIPAMLVNLFVYAFVSSLVSDCIFGGKKAFLCMFVDAIH